MAEKRMFSKTIIDSDTFLDMPLSTQALYFHLSMRADDDGFINNPKKIQRMIGCGDDDLKLLILKQFVILFESGVIVIKHWKIHNYIQNDRYKETMYREEKSMLSVEKNKAYTLCPIIDTECIQNGNNVDTECIQGKINTKSKNKPKASENEGSDECIQNGYTMDTQIRLDKTKLDKTKLDKTKLDKISIDKNRIEEDIELEKDKENNATSVLSFPTPIHELLFNNFSEAAYKTWFADTTIEINGELIIISVNGDLKKQAIQKYSSRIQVLTGKQISVKDLAEVG